MVFQRHRRRSPFGNNIQLIFGWTLVICKTLEASILYTVGRSLMQSRCWEVIAHVILMRQVRWVIRFRTTFDWPFVFSLLSFGGCHSQIIQWLLIKVNLNLTAVDIGSIVRSWLRLVRYFTNRKRRQHFSIMLHFFKVLHWNVLGCSLIPWSMFV